MLTKEQYEDAQRLMRSYLAVGPAPGSRYAQRVVELRVLIDEYERECGLLTHADIQARLDRRKTASERT